MNVVPPVAPLLAIDLESLLPFLFVIYWIVSQVFGALRRGQRAPGPQPRPQRIEPAPRPQADAGDPHGDITRQIEEFLRQASGEPPRRPAGGAGPRPAEAARPQPAVRPQTSPPAAPPRRPTTLSPRERDEALQPRDGTAEPRRVDSRSPRDRGDVTPVAEAARKGNKKPRMTRPPAAPPRSPPPSLTRLDAGTDESVERHVTEAFGRELPHLAAGQAGGPPPSAPSSSATPSLTADLVRKLRDPASIRELILIREVLDRPVHRW